MRTYLGGCLGAVSGLVVGLMAGIALSVGLVPDRPGQALDGIRQSMFITFVTMIVCTVVGCTIGALIAVPKGRRDPPADDES